MIAHFWFMTEEFFWKWLENEMTLKDFQINLRYTLNCSILIFEVVNVFEVAYNLNLKKTLLFEVYIELLIFKLSKKKFCKLFLSKKPNCQKGSKTFSVAAFW